MSVFITGITGTLGTALAQWHHEQGDRVLGCARNEKNIAELRAKVAWGDNLICGNAKDILDWTARIHATGGYLSTVYHCAAMKHIEHAERFPDEAVSQNISVLQAVIATCRVRGSDLILPSSDKACLPNSVYGATKLIAERMVLNAGYSVVRLGNLIGSSGSVFSKWKMASERGEPIKLTDPRMTRFFLPVKTAAEIVATMSVRGKAVVPGMASIEMGTLARLWPSHEVTGLRPGERLHEWSIAPGEKAELRKTELGGDVYVLGSGRIFPDGYSSENAVRFSLTTMMDIFEEIGCLPKGAEQTLMCG